MTKLRVGYVGCGFLAQKVHIPNLQSLPECELIAVAEVRPDLGRRVQERFHIPRLYASHLEMAQDSDIQAVAISGHFVGQGELAADMLRAGKHVFVEKPMAVSVIQAQRILQAERASGKRLMVGYMKRYDSGNVLVKHLLDQFRTSNELGAIRYVRCHGFCGNWTAGSSRFVEQSDEPIPPVDPIIPDWMPPQFYRGYIGYLQQYTHNINLARWFLDASDDVAVKLVDLDGQDGMSGLVVLEVGGVRTLIESGQVAYHAWDEHTQVYFERGWVRTDAPPLLLENASASVEVYRSDGDKSSSRSELFPKDGWTWSYREEMRHFVTGALQGEPFRSPASDALTDVRILEEIYRRFVETQTGNAP
jgi:predicted dehydrogenase